MTQRKNERWGDAFSARVRVPKDHKNCKHSRHCKGCLKQVCRYLELLCGKDPEAFCFASTSNIQKHTQKGDGKLYQKSIVYDCLRFLAESGVIIRTTRRRNGRELRGWILTAHEELASADASWCTWNQSKPRPKLFQSVEGSAEHSCLPAESPAEEKGPSAESPAERYCVFSGNSEGASSSVHNTLRDVSPESAHPESGGVIVRQVETVKARQVETSAQTNSKGNPKPNSISLRSSDDNDHDLAGTIQEPEAAKKVGAVLGFVRNLDDEDAIHQLSDGEFNTRTLKTYKHTSKLVAECRRAIMDLSDKQFENRSSLADVMGLAMENLRGQHQLNAPPGWIPVMRKLRADNALKVLRIDTESSEIVNEWTRHYEVRLYHRDFPPQAVCEWSYFDVVWKAVGKPNVSPEWKTRLIEVAKDLGLPYEGGFVPFMEEVILRFGDLPAGLQEMLDYEKQPP